MQQATYFCNGRQFKVYLRDEADQSVANEIFKFREYRAAEESIRAATAPLLDVGAHAGFFALYCRAFNPTVPIFCLEPEPNNLELLERHIRENDLTGMTVIRGALAGASGSAQLAISADSHNHHLVTVDKNDTIGAPRRAGRTIAVPAYTLRDLRAHYELQEIGLLKMDIEGGEYAVFESLEEKDFQSLCAVIMEYHQYGGRYYSEIEERLRGQGFGVQIFPSQFDKRMGFLLAHNKRRTPGR